MWFLFVVITSLFNCAYYFGNQTAKVSPNVFMFYRGAVPALFLLPFLPFITYVDAWQFYVLCILQGLVISFIDYRDFKAMRTWGAEAVSSLHPISIGAVFLLWLMIKPIILINYLDDLWRLGGIVATLGGIIYATASFQKSEHSKQMLQYLWPYFLGAALCDVINKLCMSYVVKETVSSASCLYIMITGAVVAMLNLIIYVRNNNKINELYNFSNLKYSFLILLLIGSMVSKNFAMYNVSNPSFVSATLYLYIVWIMLVGKVLQKLGKSGNYHILDRKKVVILLVCVIGLVLLDNK